MDLVVPGCCSVVEEWEIIEWSPGYRVSNIGNVYSYKQTKPHRVAIFTDVRGYSIANLWDNGKGRQFKVHRLVANAFIRRIARVGDTKNDVVNHIDGVKTNNVVTNLEIVSAAGNNRHAFSSGLHDGFCEGHWNSKLSNVNVIDIKALLKKNTLSCKVIGELFNVSEPTIRDIRDGRTWLRL